MLEKKLIQSVRATQINVIQPTKQANRKQTNKQEQRLTKQIQFLVIFGHKLMCEESNFHTVCMHSSHENPTVN